MDRRDGKYNGSGCLDMTAYLALRNICREEHRRLNRMRQKKSPHRNAKNCKTSKGDGNRAQ